MISFLSYNPSTKIVYQRSIELDKSQLLKVSSLLFVTKSYFLTYLLFKVYIQIMLCLLKIQQGILKRLSMTALLILCINY